jgi:hypothetical protein
MRRSSVAICRHYMPLQHHFIQLGAPLEDPLAPFRSNAGCSKMACKTRESWGYELSPACGNAWRLQHIPHNMEAADAQRHGLPAPSTCGTRTLQCWGHRGPHKAHAYLNKLRAAQCIGKRQVALGCVCCVHELHRPLPVVVVLALQHFGARSQASSTGDDSSLACRSKARKARPCKLVAR